MSATRQSSTTTTTSTPMGFASISRRLRKGSTASKPPTAASRSYASGTLTAQQSMYTPIAPYAPPSIVTLPHTATVTPTHTRARSLAPVAAAPIPLSPIYIPPVTRYCPYCHSNVPVDGTLKHCPKCNSPLSLYPARPGSVHDLPDYSVQGQSSSATSRRSKSTGITSPVYSSAKSSPITPLSPVHSLRSHRSSADDTPHPAGREALVLPSGTPTPKLQALADAIYTLLFSQVRTSSGLLDMSRMYYLEWAMGRNNFLTLFDGDTTQRVYNCLEYEYALVVTQHPNDPRLQERTPALSRKGLLSFLTHEILLSPTRATQLLNHLLRTQARHIQDPPSHLGIGYDWSIAEYMMLAAPHPSAVTRQRRLVGMMRGLGWEFTDPAWGL